MLNFTILALLILLRLDFGDESPYLCPMEVQDLNAGWSAIPRSPKDLQPAVKYLANRTIGTPQLIPRIIHQTNQRDQVPYDMRHAMETILQKNPTYSYQYFNASQRRSFIAQHMPKELLQCYDKVRPNAYKADIWRYCMVYLQGGCYMDTGFVLVKSLDEVIGSSDVFVTSNDAQPPRKALNSAFFCSVARHPILQNVLNLLVKSISEQSYGEDAIDITGPRRFLEAFRNYFNDSQLYPEKGQYQKGVKVYERVIHHRRCLITQISDFEGQTILYNKYPSYYYDMKWYTTAEVYTHFWVSRGVFDPTITITVPLGYTVARAQQQRTHN